MSSLHEFHYRLKSPAGGFRPGSHPGLSLGSGQDFAGHARLFDSPDPRRLDLRASLRNIQGDWLVRTYRQRTALSLHAVVDVSASMLFGAPTAKLQVVAEFVESMGHSAFRVGDAAGLIAFDAREREDLYCPARNSRGAAQQMGDLLRQVAASGPAASKAPASETGKALNRAVQRLAGKAGIVFLVSDLHWPLDRLKTTLDVLGNAWVVPLIIWDDAELEPPAGDGLISLCDAETGSYRSVWMTNRLRQQWRDNVAARKHEIEELFGTHNIRPFYLSGHFDSEALSRYFLEAVV